MKNSRFFELFINIDFVLSLFSFNTILIIRLCTCYIRNY